MTSYVWAVDPAVSRLAFAFAPDNGGRVHIETLRIDSEAREGQRLGWLDRQVRIYARQAAGRFPPACVFVEQPSGKFCKLPLYYTVGVVQAALYEALACPVWTLPSGRWKKSTLGVGNATKAQVAAHVLALGYVADSQDEADAVCMALAGRAMVLSEQWDAQVAA